MVRRIVERALVPHLDDQVTQIDQVVGARMAEHRALMNAGGPTAEPVMQLVDFNHLLHELRTVELRRLPAVDQVLLSAGCAGRWYFDWLDDCAGPFSHHIGVELYSPKPDDLPDDVTWISESASSMPTVDSGSVDVVFSGQNLEHLWIDDMVGFFLEASRVLRPGGLLVVDSPNRLAVEAIGWTHGQHTIEMTADEATGLMLAAGFEPREVRGLWNCRDQATGEWYDLAAPPGDIAEVLDRSVGRRPVDDDFVWWIEAERVGAADPARLRSEIELLFDRLWTRRVNRAAERLDESADADVRYRTRGFPLFAGSYTVNSSDPGLAVRLVRSDGTELARATGSVSGELADTEFDVVAELLCDASTDPLPGDISVGVEQTPSG